MTALGHKRTYAVQKGMSALPPKADMCSATSDVCFVPIADIRARQVFRKIPRIRTRYPLESFASRAGLEYR